MDDEGRSAVQVAETHSAVVLLIGDRAYKWKKPVDLGFLDFRGREQRAVACRRELELNRRLAPDVYLDVATLTGSDGTPLEHVLVMRRLPDERRLSTLVSDVMPVEECLRTVARTIASLHARTVTPEAAEAAGRDALRANWQDNLSALREAPGSVLSAEEVEQVAGMAMAYLDGRAPLFASRTALACDGHGDLLADDIFCLTDGPRILDCLDFADRYRLGDPLNDAAFLAMDLARLGREDLGRAFLDSYAEFSGQRAPASLEHHYIAYRAHVRAKVAVLRAGQGDAAAPDAARRLHGLCREHLLAGRVVMVAVGGLPGTGKSTVARAVADARGWTLLSSDEVRKELLGLPRGTRAPDDAYTREAKDRVYRELLSRARVLLEHGQPVVIDASWLDEGQRAAAEELARATVSRYVPLRCEAPLSVARARLESRVARRDGSDAGGGEDPSDADAGVLERMAQEADPWPQALSLDTTREPAEVAVDASALIDDVLAG